MKWTLAYISQSPTRTVLLLACAAFALALLLAGETFAVHKKQALVAAVAQAPVHLTFDPSRITAKAAVIYDPTTDEVLFAKNSNASLPLASLTKLMTAQTVMRLKKDNPLVAITNRDLAPEGDWGLIPGSVWRLDDLLAFGLVASSNDAMAAVAAVASPRIIDEMNRSAGELGLYQTYFLNPTGLDVDPETAGAYGSAYDVARLAAAFLKENPSLFEQTSRASISITSAGATLTATSTDTPILDIPGLIAAKTGYTELAGGNLVAVFDFEIGRPVVVAVLGSTREARFNDVRTLIEALREARTLGDLSRI